MSDGDGIGEKIYDAVLDLGRGVGRLEEECRQHSEHLASIDRRLEAGSSQMHTYGTALAQQEQRIEQLQTQMNESEAAAIARRRRCSESFKRLNTQLDGTDRHLTAINGEHRGRQGLWKELLVILGLVLTAASTFQLGQCRAEHGRAIPVKTVGGHSTK